MEEPTVSSNPLRCLRLSVCELTVIAIFLGASPVLAGPKGRVVLEETFTSGIERWSVQNGSYDVAGHSDKGGCRLFSGDAKGGKAILSSPEVRKYSVRPLRHQLF